MGSGAAPVRTGGGVAVGEMESGRKPDKPEGEDAVRPAESGVDARERVFSWFDVIRAGAQLTLDMVRVVREATDLYRKFSR